MVKKNVFFLGGHFFDFVGMFWGLIGICIYPIFSQLFCM